MNDPAINFPACLTCQSSTGYVLDNSQVSYTETTAVYVCHFCSEKVLYLRKHDQAVLLWDSDTLADWLFSCLEPAWASREAETKLFKEQKSLMPDWLSFPVYPPMFPARSENNCRGGYYNAGTNTEPAWVRIDPYVSRHLPVPVHPEVLETERYFQPVWQWFIDSEILFRDVEVLPNQYWGAQKSHEPWYKFLVPHTKFGPVEITMGWRKRVVSVTAEYQAPTSTEAIWVLATADQTTLSCSLPTRTVKLEDLPDWSELTDHIKERMREWNPSGTIEETPDIRDGQLATKVIVHAWTAPKLLQYLAALLPVDSSPESGD